MKRAGIFSVIGFITISLVMVFTFSWNKESQAAETLKLGGSLPLTGVFAETASYIKPGYEYWAEEVNQKGGLLGRPVKLIIYDDSSNADKAVSNYERLITVDKVDLLLGAYPGTAGAAVMPLAEKYKMVFIGMGGHLKAFSQGFQYSFGSPPLLGEWVGVGDIGMIEAIPPEQRPKTVAIMTMNNAIGLAVLNGFKTEAERIGLKIVMSELYSLPLVDAVPLVSKAKATKADVFFANGAFDDGVMTMRALKALNYNPKIVLQDIGADSPGWLKELKEDGYYVLKGNFWHPALPYADCAKLNKVAKEKYGWPAAPLYFGFGYSWAKTLEMGVEGAGSLDQDKIRDYLRTHSFNLPYGNNVRFDERGLPLKNPVIVTQVLDGKIELVWPKDVANAEFVYPKPPWKK